MPEIVFYLKEVLNANLVQTHSSFVLITKDFVYKIKKPVNFGFLDYSTIQKRKLYIYKELEINKRLCKDIYIEVLPISKIEDRYEFSDKNIVEYALKMKRVDDSLFLVNRLDKTNKEDMESIARVVANFHIKAKKVYDIDSFSQMKFNTDENFDQTKEFIGKTIDAKDYDFIQNAVERFYAKYKGLFLEREKRGFIVDGHGDIRLEHIVLGESICIMDAIEFNDRFRIQDQINDMCFLSMELDLRGFYSLSKIYEDTYKNITKDADFDILINFYKCYRAYVRGKVSSFLLNDEHIEDKESIISNASKLFKLSKSYAEHFKQ